MKHRLIFFICLFGTILSCAPGLAHGRDIDRIKQSATLIAATEGAYPPFNFFRGATLTGFEVELVELLAKKIGVKVEWRTLAFDAQLPALQQDRFDVAASSFGITPARQKAVDFSEPHYCSGAQIVARSGGPKSAADLAGKVVAVQIGTTYAEAVRKVIAIKEAKTFPRDTDAQQNLVSGRVDAWVTDRFVALDVLAKNPGLALQKGDLLFTEKIALALKKDNDGLRLAINNALGQLFADGSYRALSEKYFKEDIRCR